MMFDEARIVPLAALLAVCGAMIARSRCEIGSGLFSLGQTWRAVHSRPFLCSLMSSLENLVIQNFSRTLAAGWCLDGEGDVARLGMV